MVGASRDATALLSGSGATELDQAIDRGSLSRFKVRGRWIYSKEELTESDVLNEALAAVDACLAEWLLGSNPFLRGAAAGRTESPTITGAAMDILIQELCSQGKVGALPLSSANYQPYFAYFSNDDAAEIDLQLAEVKGRLSTDGRIGWRDLPEPQRKRDGRAWPMLILGHGEFLGLGWLKDRRELIAW